MQDGQNEIPPVPPDAGALAQPQSSGLAIASMVLGILSWVLCLSLIASIPAIITGHMGLGQVRRKEAPESSRGMAIAGLILGYANICISIIALMLLGLLMFLASSAGVVSPFIYML